MNEGLDSSPRLAADPGARSPPRDRVDASLAGLFLSLALHAAPLLILLHNPPELGPVSAGEHVIEIELVAAEALADALHLEEPPPTPDVEVALQAPSPDASSPVSPTDEEPRSSDEAGFPTPPPLPDPVDLTRDWPEKPLVSAAVPSVQPEAAPLEQRSAMSEGYQAAIAKHLARYRRFPKSLPRRLTETRVVLSFEIDPTGILTHARILESSGIAVIDDEALAMVHRAQPFPPAETGRTLPARFTIPVTYRIRDRS